MFIDVIGWTFYAYIYGDVLRNQLFCVLFLWIIIIWTYDICCPYTDGYLEAYYMIFHRLKLLQKYWFQHLQKMIKNAILQKNMRWSFLFS